MALVKLSVNGREYAVGCADGEEARIRELGAYLDSVVRRLYFEWDVASSYTRLQEVVAGELYSTDLLMQLDWPKSQVHFNDKLIMHADEVVDFKWTISIMH